MFKASQLTERSYSLPDLHTLSQIITDNYCVDEHGYLEQLIPLIPQDQATLNRLNIQAKDLIVDVRKEAQGGDGIDAFLQEYSLDTNEGVILMCLAETLLRIPDADTADALIKDKLSGANWQEHLKKSESLLVNASTWGLLLTGKVFRLGDKYASQQENLLDKMVGKVGEPMVRNAMYAAMKIMGKEFVLGRNIKEALKASKSQRKAGYTHSYDMLGEAALTQQDADKYLRSYADAIKVIGAQIKNSPSSNSAPPPPTISIKLSALHPRYEEANRERVLTEMLDAVSSLAELAKEQQVGLSIDAEEADRLELSLALFELLYAKPSMRGWGQLGFVVQAYSKRALPVLMWLTQLANKYGDVIPVRLVKGAYWDSEIKHCQQLGTANYPVYTRKSGTDTSYLACASYMLSEHAKGRIYSQFATHNAQTVVTIADLAERQNCPFEFQRLHGMGEELFGTYLRQNKGTNVRTYAPVGAHKDLLPYLVRRLLENGANSSFVHKLVDPNTPVESLIAHPLSTLRQHRNYANEKIALPLDIFSNRENSSGLNLNVHSQRHPFENGVRAYYGKQWQAYPMISGEGKLGRSVHQVYSPQNNELLVGEVSFAAEDEVKQAIENAYQTYPAWSSLDVSVRANTLRNVANALEQNKLELIALCNMEAGKSLPDCIDEVREAVDFCRYYANQAEELFAPPGLLPGPTGERNELFVHGKGVFACISPWNFPLAIFIGQIAAALVTGNTVVAKPAPQTSLVAQRTIELAIESGLPNDVIHLLPGAGEVGGYICQNERIAGVCFTGSTNTARAINLTLASRNASIATLIAETGGQNTMLVDSTALPEQVISDVVASAFTSAGQRYSALRILYVQEDIAPRVTELLKGAMQELKVGDPLSLNTDVGPVIDQQAKQSLMKHIENLQGMGKIIATAPMLEKHIQGHFVQPTAARISSISQLSEEHFGPILHVIPYKAKELNKVLQEINDTGFGLTLGIHSRNESHALYIASQVNVGNVYINRNQIGAVVGVQPFGGQGLSGTGPKAGGPHYLPRFVTEKTLSNNITAIGGNTSLLTLGE